MSPQSRRRGNCDKYIAAADPVGTVWTQSRACTLYWNLPYLCEFLPILTGSLVFHFVGSFIHTTPSLMLNKPRSRIVPYGTPDSYRCGSEKLMHLMVPQLWKFLTKVNINKSFRR